MTAEEWLTCNDLRVMLEQYRVTSNARKLRLFAVASCRTTVEHLLYPESLNVLTVAERFADGLATTRELCLARDAAREMEKRFKWERGRHPQERQRAAQAARLAGNENLSLGARELYWMCDAALRLEAGEKGPWDYTMSEYVPLLREVYGNPYRPVLLPPQCRTPDVTALARAAYDLGDRPKGALDPVRLAILADALEEAGAGDEVLGHLRSPGPHVRGCWAVDLALGKESPR